MMENIQHFLNNSDTAYKLKQHYKDILQKEVFSDPDVIAFLDQHDDLPQEAIDRSCAKLYEFVVEKKKYQNNQKGLIEGHYPVLICHNNRIDIEYVPSDAELVRQKEKSIKKRMKLFYMQSEVVNASFDTMDITEQRAKTIEKSLDFISKYTANDDVYYKGLYLYGAFGVGKTFLLGAIAKELTQKGYTVALVYYPFFCQEMKNSIQDNSVAQKVEQFKTVDILMIDDIGAESMSQWLRDDILAIILQHRMQYNLSTFFSSNLSMEQLQDEHLTIDNKGAREPIKARRIMERIKYLSEEVELVGKNKRHI